MQDGPNNVGVVSAVWPGHKGGAEGQGNSAGHILQGQTSMWRRQSQEARNVAKDRPSVQGQQCGTDVAAASTSRANASDAARNMNGGHGKSFVSNVDLVSNLAPRRVQAAHTTKSMKDLTRAAVALPVLARDMHTMVKC